MSVMPYDAMKARRRAALKGLLACALLVLIVWLLSWAGRLAVLFVQGVARLLGSMLF